jgi:hypothetical protein
LVSLAERHVIKSCKKNKEVKNNINFGQITGIKEKLDTTCK